MLIIHYAKIISYIHRVSQVLIAGVHEIAVTCKLGYFRRSFHNPPNPDFPSHFNICKNFGWHTGDKLKPKILSSLIICQDDKCLP